MTFAQVTNDTITTIGRLPSAARRLDNGNWVLGLPDASVELQEACGWFPLVTVDRPADTETTTFDRTVELVAGLPTVVWTERPKTQAELDAAAAAAASSIRRLDLQAAVTTLRQWSDGAEGTVVTNGNAVATLQVVVDRLAIFFDRFADLLVEQYGQS
jgi:hypothetical protein